MKRRSRLFVTLALTGIISAAQFSVFAADEMAVKKIVPKSTTENFISTLPKSTGDLSQSKKLVDGLYLIQRESKKQSDLAPLKDGEQILINNYEFIAPEERGETSYVVVNPSDFIPLKLANDPIKENDQQGKPKLSISLAEEQIAPLEKFTRDNVMKSVAIIIGGKVVTTHKIRVPIVGGKMQITRCTDHGCEALYTELEKSRSVK